MKECESANIACVLQAQLCRAAQEQQDLENRAAQERQQHRIELRKEQDAAAEAAVQSAAKIAELEQRLSSALKMQTGDIFLRLPFLTAGIVTIR